MMDNLKIKKQNFWCTCNACNNVMFEHRAGASFWFDNPARAPQRYQHPQPADEDDGWGTVWWTKTKLRSTSVRLHSLLVDWSTLIFEWQ